MPSGLRERVVLTGMGVLSSIGNDVESFDRGLRDGCCGIDRLSPLDQLPVSVGAELKQFDAAEAMARTEAAEPIQRRARRVLRNAPLAVRAGVCVAAEAYLAAGLGTLAPESVALIVGGTNLHAAYSFANYQKFITQPEYIDPKYALSSLDTSVLAGVSEVLEIRGMGFTAGGASASGNIAVVQGYSLLRAGLADACVCLGALSDLSPVDFHAFDAIGALNTQRFQDRPTSASRPFDAEHAGFVYGQGSGCVVLERLEVAERRQAPIVAEICGASVVLDGNHLANPNAEGEARAMTNALRDAEISPSSIQYVNAHGTASPAGDAAECAALREVFAGTLDTVSVNSTKSLIGHTLAAAGTIELVATILQMNGEYFHPTLNLINPIDEKIRFIGPKGANASVEYAMSNSFGFGGISTSVIVRKGYESRH